MSLKALKALKPRKTICPVCGLPGYGPYVERIVDHRSGRIAVRVQVIHAIAVGGRHKTLKTCYLRSQRLTCQTP
ncbi:MAG: hypothetical protein QW692_06295 [Nitrososphaerota archaeon]